MDIPKCVYALLAYLPTMAPSATCERHGGCGRACRRDSSVGRGRTENLFCTGIPVSRQNSSTVVALRLHVYSQTEAEAKRHCRRLGRGAIRQWLAALADVGAGVAKAGQARCRL